jgi:uncharacterized protein YcbX
MISPVATVTRIQIAPVKALGLVFPDAVDLGVDGVIGDRRFWMTDADGRLMNNKRIGPLVLIRPEWDEGTRELTLAFPDGSTVAGTVELGESTEPIIYGEPLRSRPVLGPWQQALSDFAAEPLSLWWSEHGAVDRGRHGGVASLISRGSLARIGEVAETGPLDGRRFRMLIEVDGVDPHAEDAWIGRRVQVGEAQIRFNGDVGRCLVTSQNPDTGVTDVDTLGALARYRREGVTEPLPLGVYGEVVEPGRVRIGDNVTPLDAR